MESTLEITVRSTEVDFLGHVNNAKYLEYLEWGREEWYRQTGYTFEDLENMDIGTVTVNININYYKECVKNDKLLIKTKPGKIGNSSFVAHQEVIKEETEEIAAEAQVTTVVIDLKTRKSKSIPSFLLPFLKNDSSS